MNGFFKFLQLCELFNALLGKFLWLMFKVALMSPIWVIGFVVYHLMFKGG